MKRINLKKITLCAVFCALICTTTLFASVPAPIAGNVNLGDAVIIISVFILGPVYGPICAGFGASLADLLSPYAVYAPATLIIKSLMALVFYFIYKALTSIKLNTYFSTVISSLICEAVMILGYFVFECFLLDVSTALANIPFNLIQGSFGAVIGSVLCIFLPKNNYIRNFIESLNR